MGAVALGAGVAVSCIDHGEHYRPWGDIQLITDAGSILDKSFNNAVWDGVTVWGEDASENASGMTYGFTQPAQDTQFYLQDGYATAIHNGAKTLLLPGFTHGAFGVGYINAFLDKYPGVRAVGFDTDSSYFAAPADLNETQTSFNRVLHLRYETQESGFMAAIAMGIFANASNAERNGFVVGDGSQTAKIRVATFGGKAFTSVTSYMDGLLQGMEYFNTNADAWAASSQGSQYFTGLQENGNNIHKFEVYYKTQGVVAVKHFTEDFNPGTAVPLVTDYLDSNVQFISAVAGPQTGDIVSVIRSKGLLNKAYGLGVDTEQSALYGSDYILGSQMKGLTRTTRDALNNFDAMIREQNITNAHGDFMLWRGIASTTPEDDLSDPAQMYTGFAFNPVFRPTMGQNPLFDLFDRDFFTSENAPAYICDDGFGKFSGVKGVTCGFSVGLLPNGAVEVPA